MIVHFEVANADERGGLVGLGGRFVEEPLVTANAPADAEVVTVFVHSRVDAAAIERMPRLKLVATRSTGFDHVDLVACRARGIAVANVPYYGENTVAEHTFALILALARKIVLAHDRVRAGQFSPEGLTGFDLKGKVLGVVGAGSIGLHVIRIARGFGMEVVAYDVHEQHLLGEVLGFRYAPLDEVLATAHVVSLHVPAIPATHHLVNRERLARMRRGAVLINTARGAVVDTDALLEALESGHLAGAGLDVLEGEEHLAEDVQLLAEPRRAEALRVIAQRTALVGRRDVIFTPHVGFNSREAKERIVATTIENVRSFLAGAPRNLVR